MVNGWEYEPDQRHAEMVIQALGLAEGKEAAIPGEEEKKSTSAGKKAEPAMENAQETIDRMVPGFCAATVAARMATTSSIDFEITSRKCVDASGRKMR